MISFTRLLKNRGKEILKNTILNSLDRIVMVLARLGSAIVIARFLGPEGYGSFQLAITMSIVLATFSDFGFGIANNYLAGRFPSFRSGLLWNSLIFVSGVGIFGAFLANFLVSLFQVNAFSMISGVCQWWLLFSVPLQAISISITGIVYGANKFREKVIGTFLHHGTFFLLATVLALLGCLSKVNTMISWIIGLGVSLLYLIIVLLKGVDTVSTWNWVIFKKQFSYGLNSLLYNVANMLNFRFDLFLVALFLRTEYVGWYALAASITEVLLYLPKALSNVVLTETAMSSESGVKPSYHLVYKGTVLITGTAIVILAGLAPFLIPAIFSGRFVSAVIPLFLLLPGTFAMAIGIVAAYHLFGLGKALQPSLAALSATIVTIILDVLLIPALGIWGAALASTIAYAVFCFICIYFVASEVKTNVASLLLVRKHDIRAFTTVMCVKCGGGK